MGIPLSAGAGGLAMDADRIMVLTKALDADAEKPKQFMLSSGMNSSALEHSVPEQLFSTSENPAEGISAVKALKIANDQGMPIYTIDQSNINIILPQLQTDGGTISDIQNAVNAGKVVTGSKTDITYNGWTGMGYIIIDPNTGEGAYMISGGMSGAWIQLKGILQNLFLLLATILIVAGIIIVASLILIALITVIVVAVAALIAIIAALTIWAAAWASVAWILLSTYAIGLFLALLLEIAWKCYMISPPSLPDETTAICTVLALTLILISTGR